MCPKCKGIIPQNLKYCDDCGKVAVKEKRITKQKSDKKYNAHRDERHQQFYHSKEWQLLRAVKLTKAGYQCEKCKESGHTVMAVDVHHVKPISLDWDKRLDMDNLECLCLACHNKAHDRWGCT